jgi:hypothetical protein
MVRTTRGWPVAPRVPIFGGVSYFSRFSPIRAYRDLRLFLSDRQPYELIFLALAIIVTGTVITVFYFDSRIEQPYKRPEIIWVDSWPADRSDAQIKAKQAVDKVEEDKLRALIAQKQAERRAEFKRLNDKLERWGL